VGKSLLFRGGSVMRIIKKTPEVLKNLMVSDIDNTSENMIASLKKRFGDGIIDFDQLVKAEFCGYTLVAIRWLIVSCKYCQTPEVVEYFKSLNPHFSRVSPLIVFCKYCQTPEMLEYYKSLKPDYEDVSWLIRQCEYCYTQEMVEYMHSLDPE
jgi:hypothetical protein